MGVLNSSANLTFEEEAQLAIQMEESFNPEPEQLEKETRQKYLEMIN